MLKKQTNLFFILSYLCIFNIPSLHFNIRIPHVIFFWFFVKPEFTLFKILRSQFFFKLLKFRKPKVSFYYKRRRTLLRQRRGIKLKFNYTGLIKWFFIVGKVSGVRKKQYNRSRLVTFKKFSKFYFKRFRKYKIKKKFMKLLKQKIQYSQVFTGSFLFNVNKKVVLCKLFLLFRSLNNNIGLCFYFKKKIFWFLMFRFFFKKYNAVMNVFNIKDSYTLSTTHVNILKDVLFFNKKCKWIFLKNKKLKFSVFMKRKYKKYIRYLFWLKFEKFSKFHSIRKYTHLQTHIILYDTLTSIYYTNFEQFQTKQYYMNYIFNAWNVRSYNWKQIT